MIEILTDTAAVGQEICVYIKRRILACGYCSVEDVAHRNGVRSVEVFAPGWPLHRLGWFKIPKNAFLKDSMEDFWRIQLDDPVLLNNNRPFFVKSPNGTWEDINESIEPLVGTYPYVGRKNGKTYLNSITCDGIRGGKIYDVKTIHKEDMVDVMAYSSWIEEVIGKTFNDLKKEEFRKRFEYPLTPKSIEQSADHKTVCVLWQDGSKTIVKLSDNDKDDIDTAFAYALAKKIFGTNTHLKKVVRQKLNEHKPKNKKEDN